MFMENILFYIFLSWLLAFISRKAMEIESTEPPLNLPRKKIHFSNVSLIEKKWGL